MQQVLSVSEIKAAYPDQWVLVGNPEMSVDSLMSGVVIWHGKDKREILKENIIGGSDLRLQPRFLQARDLKIGDSCCEYFSV